MERGASSFFVLRPGVRRTTTARDDARRAQRTCGAAVSPRRSVRGRAGVEERASASAELCGSASQPRLGTSEPLARHASSSRRGVAGAARGGGTRTRQQHLLRAAWCYGRGRSSPAVAASASTSCCDPACARGSSAAPCRRHALVQSGPRARHAWRAAARTARVCPCGGPRARQCGSAHGSRWRAGARCCPAHTAPRMRVRASGCARLPQPGQPAARPAAWRQSERARDGSRGALLRACCGAAASSSSPGPRSSPCPPSPSRPAPAPQAHHSLGAAPRPWKEATAASQRLPEVVDVQKEATAASQRLPEVVDVHRLPMLGATADVRRRVLQPRPGAAAGAADTPHIHRIFTACPPHALHYARVVSYALNSQ